MFGLALIYDVLTSSRGRLTSPGIRQKYPGHMKIAEHLAGYARNLDVRRDEYSHIGNLDSKIYGCVRTYEQQERLF